MINLVKVFFNHLFIVTHYIADLTVLFVLLWLRVVATYRVYLLFADFEYLKQIHSNDGTYYLLFNDTRLLCTNKRALQNKKYDLFWREEYFSIEHISKDKFSRLHLIGEGMILNTFLILHFFFTF